MKWKIDEAEAKMNKLGLWMHNQITPYEQRMKQLQQTETNYCYVLTFKSIDYYGFKI